METTHGNPHPTGTVLVLLFAVLALLLVLVVGIWRGISLTYVLAGAGVLLAAIGLGDYMRGRCKATAAKITIGNMALELSWPLALLVLGLVSMGCAAVLSSRASWEIIVSREAIEEASERHVAELVPEKYRRLLALAYYTKTEIPEDERALQEAAGFYWEGQYEECIECLDKVRPHTDAVRDEVLYYSIMARYRALEFASRGYETISTDRIADLESRFKRFLNERQESKRFCTIQYWLGHFYLQVCRDQESALQVFDEIVANYAYSDWVQGSLYYSALLHHKRNTEEDIKVAIANLKVLCREDGVLKIVEIDREYNAAVIADRLLKKWGVAVEHQKASEAASRPPQESRGGGQPPGSVTAEELGDILSGSDAPQK